jgi:hypothetical protein
MGRSLALLCISEVCEPVDGLVGLGTEPPGFPGWSTGSPDRSVDHSAVGADSHLKEWSWRWEMRPFRWLGIVALLAVLLSSCGNSPTGQAARSTSPSTPRTHATSSPTSTPVTSAPKTFAHVGDTPSVSTSPVLGPGTPAFNVTLNHVFDFAHIQVPSHPAPRGERFVEMNVTIANVGSATLSIQDTGEPYVLSFTWYLNPSDTLPDLGLKFTEDFPSATCQGVPQSFSQDDLSPGQSLTGCVQFGSDFGFHRRYGV